MAKANIMIVEDEAIVGKELKASMEGLGYKVTSVVKTGEKALEKAVQDRPNLILMDIKLKGQMDGIKAAELIRSSVDIPVIFLTAYADEEKLERAKLTMPFGYILKPFQDSDLKVTIDMGLYAAKINAKRRQAEKALLKSHSELERQVEKRTAKLTSTNKRLEQEIDVRKQMEKELRLKNMVFETAITANSTADNKGILTHVNNAFIRTWGYENKEEAVGKHFSEFIKFEDEAKKIITALDEVGKWEGEYTALKKGGTTFAAYGLATNIKNESGKVIGFQSAVLDITDRNQTETKLSKSKEILQAAVDGISDPLIMLNKDLSVKVLNKAAMKYYRASDFKKVIGKPCFEGLQGKKTPCKGCEITSVMQSGQEKTFERKGFMEPEKIEQVVIYPMHHKDHQEEAAIVRISDVTEARQMERELIQADKMISLGVLVSGVAHEINNPNNFIMLNGPLLREAWESIVPVLERYYDENGEFSMAGLPYSEMRDEIPKLFSGIKEGSERIQRIVKDLKDFARQDEANMDQSVNINETIKSSIRLTGNLIKKTTKKFRVKYGRNLPSIMGNKQKLEQVMINLIQNACQALSDKGKEIFVASSFDKEGGGVVVEVRDEGEGIPENLLARIMDPFFTTKRKEGGTGLGMSVSSNIVKGHGGKIEVESECGRGTAIRFFIPTTRVEEPVKILVTDDDSVIREWITATLEKPGIYSVREASNGAEAFLKIGQTPPDLLILDVLMPDMDGVEVCRLIKEKPELSAIKVIIITGFAESSHVREIASMGFDKILAKPFRTPALLNMVDEVLEVQR